MKKRLLSFTSIYLAIYIWVHLGSSTSCQAEASDDPIILEHADKAEFVGFLSERGKVIFEGRVRASFKETRLEADSVQVDLEKGVITAWGNITLQEPKRILKGKRIIYNLTEEKVLADNGVEVKIDRLYVDGEGAEMEMKEERRTDLKKGDFTTCNYTPPHYKVKASRVVIYPEKNLWAYNVIFYLGRVPIFYFPIYYHSLSHKGPPLFINPGYSKKEGWYLRSRYGVFLENSHLDLFLDYFQRRGFGKGIDYRYRFGKDATGKFFLYHISEKEILYDEKNRLYHNEDDPIYTQRWRFLFSHYQSLLDDLFFTGVLNYQSDESISHDINRGEYPRIKELNSYLALTQRKTDYIARLSGERRDSWDGKNFAKRMEEAPRLKVWQRPTPLGPLYYQFKTDLVNEYKDLVNEYKNLVNEYKDKKGYNPKAD
ncbi:TPA: hypothetical protein DCX15_04065, partial [bacterium]|nr:hypothetical protein [bacterium]